MSIMLHHYNLKFPHYHTHRSYHNQPLADNITEKPTSSVHPRSRNAHKCCPTHRLISAHEKPQPTSKYGLSTPNQRYGAANLNHSSRGKSTALQSQLATGNPPSFKSTTHTAIPTICLYHTLPTHPNRLPRNHPHDQQLPPSYTYIKTRLKHNSTQIKPTLHLKHAIFPKAHHSLTSSSTKNHPAQQARNYPHTKKPHPYQQPENPK
eukprot:gene2948-1930_t